MASASTDTGQVARRVDGILESAQMGSTPREEPFRHWSGWHCPRCDSTNTIIEEYDRTIEGYCMSCARYQPIPRRNLHAFYKSVTSRTRRKVVPTVPRVSPMQEEDTWGREGEGQSHGGRASANQV